MSDTFTADSRGTLAVALAMMLAIAVETVAMHFLLWPHHRWWAMALDVLSVYSILWLLADQRARSRRVISIDADVLTIRVGLRFTATSPLENVADVSRARGDGGFGKVCIVNAARPAIPNVRVAFASAVTVERPFGIRQQANVILLRLNDPDSFIARVNDSVSARREATLDRARAR